MSSASSFGPVSTSSPVTTLWATMPVWLTDPWPARRAGVGEVQVNEVSRAQAGPHGGSDDIDATVHAVGTHGLRAENLPVGAHVHEDVHGLGTGEIARVLVRVRVHREVLHARGVEGLAVSASARDEAVAGIVIVVPCAQQACGYPTSVQCCGRTTHQ